MAEKNQKSKTEEMKEKNQEEQNAKIRDVKGATESESHEQGKVKDGKKTGEKRKEKKKEVKTKKKTEAFVKVGSLPISTKHSIAICRFIKGKDIETAIAKLEEVINKKTALPMKGEIPHRKGNLMSGRYPIKAARAFIKLLKSLAGNSNVNGIEEPIIFIASASTSNRPLKRWGRRKFKRTYVYLLAREKTSIIKMSGKN